MDKLINFARFLLSVIIFQILAYVTVDTMNPVAFQAVPFEFLGKDTGKIVMHLVFSIMALMVSITTYD